MNTEKMIRDDRLIFIVSQPRSGSTLLQHILGSHPDIFTLPEPWLMLNFVYGIRASGIQADFNARHTYLALQDFLKRIPGGEESYISAIRQAATYLYGKALESVNKTFFLDKTPRYYHILPELYRFFPNAKFIILIRNPVAVFSSILKTNFRGDWQRLFELKDRKHDLFTAPRLIRDGIKNPGENTTVIRYEDIVNSPQERIRDLCRNLNIDFHPDMLEYGGKIKFDDTTFVDPKSIYKHTRPVNHYKDNWITSLDTAQKNYFAREYLSALGRGLVKDLGYSYEEIHSLLKKKQFNSFYPLVPFSLIIKDKQEMTLRNRLWLMITISLQKKSMSYFIRKFKQKLKSFVLVMTSFFSSKEDEDNTKKI